MLDELPKASLDLESLLYYGSLPEIILQNDLAIKDQDLESYVVTYLEEEIRQEAIVRKVGNFIRFLQLAAQESGNMLNFNKLSQDIAKISSGASNELHP